MHAWIETEPTPMPMKIAFYATTQVFQLAMLIALMFMVGDLLAVYTMQWTELSGYPLMTAFCCIYLIFTFWRDFVLLSVLSFATDTLKVALRYRLGSSFVDMLAVIVMSFISLAMLMPED